MSRPNYGTKTRLTINLERECLRCGKPDKVEYIDWTPGMLGSPYDAGIAAMGGDCSHCEACLSPAEKEDALFSPAPVPQIVRPEHVSDEDIAWQLEQPADGLRAYAH